MKRFNFLRAELHTDDDDPPGYDTAWASIARAIDSTRIGGNLIEVRPGQAAAPYHWEAGHEEWLYVLAGEPVVRTPDGEEQLRQGDIVCFPSGPAGAHQVFNRTDARVHLMMISNRTETYAIVYPDSNKIGVRTPHDAGRYRLGDTVDYWHGEGG
jgi:uncharacterized cupin superfamily protein